MPPGKGLIGDHVRWALVEDARVAGHLDVPAEPGPLQCFHCGADCDGRDATEAQTLDVAEWDAPAAVCDESLTHGLNVHVRHRLHNHSQHHINYYQIFHTVKH